MSTTTGDGARLLIHPPGDAGVAYRAGMAAYRKAARMGCSKPNTLALAAAEFVARCANPGAILPFQWEAAGYVHEWRMDGSPENPTGDER